MGINHIHILQPIDDDSIRIAQALAVQQQALIEAHNRGEHTYGYMRRDCPLCHAS